MAESAHTVGIVVDPNFGERLRAVAERIHTWIVDTPTNRAVAEAIWRATRGGHDLERGVTTFNAKPGDSPAEWCRGILSMIEEHHGQYSHVPPVSVLQIYGTELTPALMIELAALGFVQVEPLPERWRISSRPAG